MKIATNKVRDVISFFREELAAIYPKEEIEQFVFLAFAEYLNFTRADLTMKANETMSESELLKFNFCVKDLKKQKPIQYILGSTEFYGCKIKVNEYVLIPRPETEELVKWIEKEQRTKNKEQRTILDIGTGSGCIAIALKKIFSDAEVSGLDVSENAIEVAKENAKRNNVEINFIEQDILSSFSTFQLSNFDIIVSNPPYITVSEKEKMRKNVLDYEPHIALFVNDDDALKFYKAIADFAKKTLTAGGVLFLEINETQGSEVKKLLGEKGFKDAEVKKDLSGKNRMVRGEI